MDGALDEGVERPGGLGRSAPPGWWRVDICVVKWTAVADERPRIAVDAFADEVWLDTLQLRPTRAPSESRRTSRFSSRRDLEPLGLTKL